MKTMNLPGFTATSSLRKSTISYGQFGTLNFRRRSSQIQPQLEPSDPRWGYGWGDFTGVWGGYGGGGSGDLNFDVPTPVDLGSPSSKQACGMCRSRCMRLPPSRRADCLDACPCD
jgi:hypothetical protein